MCLCTEIASTNEFFCFRFLSTGWTSADAINMVDVYRSLPQSDVQR